jgi:radical SAM protein with 4Fe4S-binding SPASM domain
MENKDIYDSIVTSLKQAITREGNMTYAEKLLEKQWKKHPCHTCKAGHICGRSGCEEMDKFEREYKEYEKALIGGDNGQDTYFSTINRPYKVVQVDKDN